MNNYALSHFFSGIQKWSRYHFSRPGLYRRWNDTGRTTSGSSNITQYLSTRKHKKPPITCSVFLLFLEIKRYRLRRYWYWHNHPRHFNTRLGSSQERLNASRKNERFSRALSVKFYFEILTARNNNRLVRDLRNVFAKSNRRWELIDPHTIRHWKRRNYLWVPVWKWPRITDWRDYLHHSSYFDDIMTHYAPDNRSDRIVIG